MVTVSTTSQSARLHVHVVPLCVVIADSLSVISCVSNLVSPQLSGDDFRLCCLLSSVICLGHNGGLGVAKFPCC